MKLASLAFGKAAALAAAFLFQPSYADTTLSDEERRRAALLSVGVEDNNDLRKQRYTCDSGGLPDFKRNIEAKGIPFPKEHTFCRTVLREEAKRGSLYTFMHKDDHAGIYAAVSKQQLQYNDRQGNKHNLLCERAYDAGYQIGYMKPEMKFQLSLQNDANKHAELCFTSDTLHPALGFVAGVHHAQKDAKRN